MRIGRRSNDTSDDNDATEKAISRQGSNKSVLYQVLEEEGGAEMENENIYKEISADNKKESNAYQSLISLSTQNYAALLSAHNSNNDSAFQPDIYTDLNQVKNNISDQQYMSLNIPPSENSVANNDTSNPTHCHEERLGSKYDTDDYVDF
jgi:hypothetical protein